MDTTRHDKVFKTSSPRTGRELDAMAGGGAGVVVGGSSGSGGGGVRYHSELLGVINSSNYLDTETAIHLTAEKLAEINSFYDKFLRKDTPDTAHEPITFEKGITVTGGISSDTLYVEKGATAGSLYVEETSSTRDLVVRRLAEILQLNVTEVATLARAIVKEFVSSETFIPGFAGEGFKIWQIAAGEWHGEIDSLTIRRSLNAFELLIQKYRAINGGLVISQGSGKIKSVTETDTHYLLEMEGNLTLMPDDFIRCQTWGTGEVESYPFDFNSGIWLYDDSQNMDFEHTSKSMHLTRASAEMHLLAAYGCEMDETIHITLKITGINPESTIYTIDNNHLEGITIDKDGTYTFVYTRNKQTGVWGIAYKGIPGAKNLLIEQVPEQKIETVTNKFYWAKVDGIEEGKVKVLKSEFDDGNQQPVVYPYDFTDASKWTPNPYNSPELVSEYTDHSFRINNILGTDEPGYILLVHGAAGGGGDVNISLKISGLAEGDELRISNGTASSSDYRTITADGTYTFNYTDDSEGADSWTAFVIAYTTPTAGTKNLLIEQIPEQPGFNSAWMFDANNPNVTHTLTSIHLTAAREEQEAITLREIPPGESIRLNLQVTGLTDGQEIRVVGANSDEQKPTIISKDGTYKIEYSNTRPDAADIFGIGYKGAIGPCDITVSIVPDSTNAPAVGDEVVQMGNATDVTRQALILLSASDGKPCIDLLAGVNSKSFAGKLQMRAGCLDGIQDPDFPTDLQPSGYGLYCSNAFLKGSLVLRNGKSVDAEIEGVRTELTAIPGQITAAVTSVKEYTDSSVGNVREELNTNISAIPGQIKVEIGKMQIGANNLIPNSSFEEEGFFTGGNLGQYVERWGATPTDILPVAGSKFIALYTEENTDFFTGVSHYFKVEPNTPYVFSIYLYRSNMVGFTSSRIYHYQGAAGINDYIDSTEIPVPETAGKWERIIVPFTTLENENYITFRIGFNSTAFGGAVLFADCVQLEKGTVPTAWREASADILSQTQSLIKAESDQLLFQVTRTTTGTRNYVLSSRMNRTSNHWATGGTVDLVTDEKFGTVVEYSRPDGGGEYQFVWELSNTTELNNNDIVFSVIAKRISETGDWNFGGWNTTFDLCRTTDSNQIDLGGGWIHYWTTRKIDYIRGTGNTGTFGINSVSGTWRFYAVGVYKGNKPVDWTAAPEDLESRVSQAELNLQPDNIWLGISNKMSTAVLPRTKQTVDATGLDQSTYYPVTIRLSETEPYTITVHRSLWASYGVPSWSTHSGGFSVVCRWTSNGAGWGTIAIMRTVHEFRYSFSNVLPVGSINQLTNGSREIIWVRGGSKYDIMVEGTPTADIMLHSTTFTEHGQSASPTTSIVEPEPNWDALSRTGINIDTKEITINAETTKIVSNGQVAALFTTDANGNPIIQGRFLHLTDGAKVAGFVVDGKNLYNSDGEANLIMSGSNRSTIISSGGEGPNIQASTISAKRPCATFAAPEGGICLSLVGSIAGLGFNIGIFGYNEAISPAVVFAIASGSRIKLPDSRMSKGQCIFIKNRSGGRITVDGNGHSIYTNAPISAMNINSNGETFMYVFDGTYWNAAKFEL